MAVVVLTYRVHLGDCRDKLRELDAESVQCVVTSPPYWGLRDYGVEGQLGLESTPYEFVERMVEVFAEVRRVLRPDGVVWLNLGDCYATGAGKVGDHPGGGEQGARWKGEVTRHRDSKRRDHGRPSVNGRGESQVTPGPGGHRGDRGGHEGKHGYRVGPGTQPNRLPIEGLKPKDLVGVPWRVALALQADGWWLRSDVVWSKPNPMPESVLDRPTRSHEYVFMLTKSERYFYDSAAIAEASVESAAGNSERKFRIDAGGVEGSRAHQGFSVPWAGSTRNRRTVWTIATSPFPEAHFATFPEALVEPCILAGSRQGDVVLDPFSGAGTTGVVALKTGRNYLGVELNPDYVAMSERRLANVSPLFAAAAT